MALKELFNSILGGCSGFERTDFNSFYFGGCGGLEKTHH